MPDENQTTTPTSTDVPTPIIDAPAPSTPPAATPVVSTAPADQSPEESPTDPEPTEEEKQAQTDLIKDVANRINEAHNILVALSSDPNVDELSAAIGLSLYLDKLGKRATAIYSGTTPNALEFLKPDETFDKDTDVLQDFVIALNKEKADHLRYKLDGDYVKIFITPYKSRIAKADLEFSYGDFNIDLVLSLNVANGTDLDAALREHGRIMHDATVINITTGNPGKFGEIEWSNKHSSSICEMTADLLYNMSAKTPLEPEEATAFLTGIIAATDRFSNPKTTPDTMQLASKLMESGADQQLITQNISDAGNNFFNLSLSAEDKHENDPTALAIDHDADDEEGTEEFSSESLETEPTPEPETDSKPSAELESLPDLSAVAASLSSSPEPEPAPASPLTPSADFMNEMVSAVNPSAASSVATDNQAATTEKVITPPENFAIDAPSDTGKKYSQMLEEALREEAPTIQNPVDAAPIISDPLATNPTAVSASTEPTLNASSESPLNPAASFAPAVPDAPEVNGVPEINYSALDTDEDLPPPPAPPIDLNSPVPPTTEPAQHLPASSENAFQIPGAA